MKKLRFRTKVFIGFIIIITFCIIISIISLSQLKKVEKNVNLIYTHPLAVSNAVRDINICINGIQNSMKDVVLAENEKELNRAVNEVDYLNNKALESFDIVFDRFLGDIKDVKTAYTAFIDWKDIRKEVIDLKRNGKEHKAADVSRGKGAKHVEYLLESTKVMTDFAKAKADEFKANTQNTYNQTFNTLLLVVILVIGLSVFISIIVAQGINTPLKAFISDIRDLYLEEHLIDNKKAYVNEVDLLKVTVDELKNAYQKIKDTNHELEALNEDLDDKVKERTIELETKQIQLKEKNEEYAAINEELLQTNEELILAKERAEKNEYIAKEKTEEFEAINEELRQTNKELQIAKEKAEHNEIVAKEKTEEFEAINEELRQTNEELQISKNKIEESEVRLREAQELAKIGNWELNIKTDELYWSDEIFRIFECDPNTFEGTYESFINFIHEEDREFVDNSYKKHLFTKEPYDIVHRIVTQNGDIKFVNERCRSEFDGNGKAYRSLGTIADITERIENEKSLLKAKEKAEESDQLKSAFLANMSHEIRTPMNGIIGFAKLLQKEQLSKEKLDQYVKVIVESSNQLLHIVNDILDISKIETGQIEVYNEKTDICQLLNEVVTFFDLKASEKDIDLSYNCSLSEKDSVVNVDQAKLKQILYNLVSNSLKFTNQGFIEINCELNGDELQFSVKDSGVGIPKKEQHKIFDRFSKIETTAELYSGTGLGLSICKGYIEALNGKIWFESNVGQGTVFLFSLPFERIESPLEQIITEKQQLSDFNDATILIVEDEELNFEYIQELLANRRINYLHAKTGKEALEMFMNNPNIDLILMDIRLPEMDGYSVTKEIRKQNPNIPIIAQTAYALAGDREKAINAGCDDYITKPIVEDNFNTIIKKYLS